MVEVVSEDDPGRDLVTKRLEYAQAGIPEYWIVDPRKQVNCCASVGRGDLSDTHGQFGMDAVLYIGYVVWANGSDKQLCSRLANKLPSTQPQNQDRPEIDERASQFQVQSPRLDFLCVSDRCFP